PERERRVADAEGRDPALTLGVLLADASVGRSGETLRQDEWRDELLKCGIRGKKKQHIHFSRVETLSGTRWPTPDSTWLNLSSSPSRPTPARAPATGTSPICTSIPPAAARWRPPTVRAG
ncbi:MAG: hypothetical protein KAY37_10270, partial [Phycisphaerae bacterium]|nr:hypothetical protein [Phycisphaerae bacterium]